MASRTINLQITTHGIKTKLSFNLKSNITRVLLVSKSLKITIKYDSELISLIFTCHFERSMEKIFLGKTWRKLP